MFLRLQQKLFSRSICTPFFPTRKFHAKGFIQNIYGRLPALAEDDIEESFVKGSGPGGQKINKVRNCVQLKHRPTGIQVSCQKTRKLEENRKIARKELALKVDAVLRGKESVLERKNKRMQDLKRRKKNRARRRQRARTAENIEDK